MEMAYRSALFLVTFLLLTFVELKAQQHDYCVEKILEGAGDSIIQRCGSDGAKILQYKKAKECLSYDASILDSLHFIVQKSSLKPSHQKLLNQAIRLASNNVSGDVYAYVRTIRPRLALKFNQVVPLMSLYRLEREWVRQTIFIKATTSWITELCQFSLPNQTNELKIPLEIKLYGFKQQEVVADIGAGAGSFERALSKYCDSLEVFVNDIDASVLEPLNTQLILLETLDKKNIAYTTVLGNDTSTNLPSRKFDKLIVKNAFHHFQCPVEMLEDFKRVLKKKGRIYIVDVLKEEAGEKPACALFLSRRDFLRYFDDNGFYLAREEKLDYMNFRFFEFQLLPQD
jgi:ubiquinone/menaquinone biosynthesis C-methylase UbiE